MANGIMRWVYVASFVAHGALAIVVSQLDDQPRYETTNLTMQDAQEPEPPKETPPPPPPPPPPEPETPRPRVRRAEAPPPPEAEPPPAAATAPVTTSNPALDALPDFGLSLGGSTGSGGIAVPTGPRTPVARETRVSAPRVLGTAPREQAQDECSEEATRPRPLSVPQPVYPESARSEEIEGRVRLQIDVDAEGQVTAVRLLEGLGHGLDEAAIDAARAATFEPATRCGRPTTATFTISIRFTL
jgi:protein TonB